MFAPIMSALAQGFSSKQVLQYIAKNFPKYTHAINTAMAAGYGADVILKKIGGKKGRGLSDDTYLTPHERTEKMDKERGEKHQKAQWGAVGAGAALLGGLAAMPRAAGAVMPSQILPAQRPPVPTGQTIYPRAQRLPYQQQGLPAPQQRGLPSPGRAAGATQGQTPTQRPPVSPQAQSPTIPTPSSPSRPQQPASNIIDALNLGKQIQQIASANSISDTAAVVDQVFLKPGQKKWLKENSDEPLESLIGRYLEEQQQGQEQQSAASPQIDQPSENEMMAPTAPGLGSPETPPPPQDEMPPVQQEAAPSISAIPDVKMKAEKKNATKAKGSVVVTPDGKVGEVVGNDKSGALVKVDGKTRKIPESDLEGESEDVVEAVQNILNIPEVDRSSIVSLFTYDPEDSTMYIQYHDGSTYKYLDVDPEKVLAVANKMGIPVTKGKNIFGAWSPQDKKSLGATLIKEIIRDPKYAKSKPGQPENTNYRRLETLYDYWKKLRKEPKRKK